MTTNLLGDIVHQVVGDTADVEFAAPTRQPETMAEADLLVTNGAGFEQGMADVLDRVAESGVATPRGDAGPVAGRPGPGGPNLGVMCAACVAQGVAYVGGALAGLQVMGANAKAKRRARKDLDDLTSTDAPAEDDDGTTADRSLVP